MAASITAHVYTSRKFLWPAKIDRQQQAHSPPSPGMRHCLQKKVGAMYFSNCTRLHAQPRKPGRCFLGWIRRGGVGSTTWRMSRRSTPAPTSRKTLQPKQGAIHCCQESTSQSDQVRQLWPPLTGPTNLDTSGTSSHRLWHRSRESHTWIARASRCKAHLGNWRKLQRKRLRRRHSRRRMEELHT